MLALPFALLLALPAPQPASSAAAVQSSLLHGPLIPSGTATGCWVGATLQEEGVIVALLQDDFGRPLFVMDGHLVANGMIYGELRALEYAANPAVGLPVLFVAGHAQVDPYSTGTFWADISSPLDSMLPVKPFGRIEGVLLHGLTRLEKPGYGQVDPVLSSQLGAAAQAGGATGVGAIDPRRRVTGFGGVDPQLRVSLGRAVQAAGAQSVESLFRVAISQAQAATGFQQVDPLRHAIFCPKGPELVAGSQSAAAGFAEAEPELFGGIIVCPHVGPTVGGAAQAAQASAIGGLPQGLTLESSAAGAAQGVDPVALSAGEGRVRATWYLLP